MIWLLFAIALSVAFAWIATWASRRPRSLNHGIREFSRGLEALAPDDDRGGHVRPLAPPGGFSSAAPPAPEPTIGELGDDPPLVGEGR